MKKTKLHVSVNEKIVSTRDALQIVWDSITAQGQKKKALKNPEVRALLEFYGIVEPED